MSSTGQVIRRRVLLATVVASALFAFYLPSSVGGVISRPLSVLSIAGTCGFLATLLAVSGRTAPLANVVVALGIMVFMGLFTITSPFEEYSPGVILLYLALTLLFMLDLRSLASRRVDQAFQVVTIVSLVLGYALALDVGVVDQLMVRWYGAFYKELVSNMVGLFDKPVLTFATHSMAGFMIYLLFYMQLRGWQLRGQQWRLGAALGFLGLLLLLKSTTGLAYAVVAGAQLALIGYRRYLRGQPLVVVGLLLAVLAGVVAGGFDFAAQYDRVEDAVVGDRIRGLWARYAGDGLLAGNFAYLSSSPLSPIGAGATDTLYLGDSGFIVNLLRGSVLLLVAVYGGLWLFFVTNLVDRPSATWVWVCTLLFEIGFTPLQYFRFLAFVPFLVVYLNSLEPSLRQPASLALDH